MITADELVDMQAVLEDTMPDELIVHRLTRTPDTSMGTIEQWTPIPEAVPCRYAPLAGGVGSAMAEALIAGRIGSAEAWIFTVPLAADILSTDRVVVGLDGFEVTLVLEPRTWEISQRFVAVRLA